MDWEDAGRNHRITPQKTSEAGSLPLGNLKIWGRWRNKTWRGMHHPIEPRIKIKNPALDKAILQYRTDDSDAQRQLDDNRLPVRSETIKIPLYRATHERFQSWCAAAEVHAQGD
jgi:hypothetical protein